MREDLKAFLAPREERITFAGVELLVRELETAAEFEQVSDDVDWRFLVMVKCVFLPNGEPAFTRDDIADLKKSSRTKLLPIVAAVNRVNGFQVEIEEKNSGAGPSAG